jgi:hypothetical protein
MRSLRPHIPEESTTAQRPTGISAHPIPPSVKNEKPSDRVIVPSLRPLPHEEQLLGPSTVAVPA